MVVLEALSQDLDALQYAAPELLSDPAFALEAIGHHGRAMARGGVSTKLQDDKDWVLMAMQKNPDALAYADNDHRLDRDVINSSIAGRLGKLYEGGTCSGILWKVDEGSVKWAAGTTALALEELQKEAEAAQADAAPEEKLRDLR